MTSGMSGGEPEYSIVTRALTKRFGAHTAVDSLDLSVERGTIYGLVGPDGAGKTTTLRMLCGALGPSSGTASVAGFDITRELETLRYHLGYMPQAFSLYPDLSVEENLDFFADIYQVPHGHAAGTQGPAAGVQQAHRFPGAPRRAPLRRHEEEAGPGLHPDPRAQGAAAGRAHHRRRPGVAPRAVAHPVRPAAHRRDHRGDHALHGRGRALQPGGLSHRRAAPGERLAGGAGPAAQAHGHRAQGPAAQGDAGRGAPRAGHRQHPDLWRPAAPAGRRPGRGDRSPAAGTGPGGGRDPHPAPHPPVHGGRLHAPGAGRAEPAAADV